MPWWGFVLLGMPATAMLAYGQWLGLRTLKHDKALGIIEARCIQRGKVHDRDQATIRRMFEKIDTLCTEVAGLTAKLEMMIDGR